MEIQTYKAIREAYGDTLLWAMDKKFKNEADEDAQIAKLLQQKFDSAGIVVHHAPNCVPVPTDDEVRQAWEDADLKGQLVGWLMGIKWYKQQIGR
jgi:hypothetical protein